MSVKSKKKTAELTPAFRQYTPRDVYAGSKVVEEINAVSPGKEVVKRFITLQMHETGCEPLDIWLNNICRHGFRNRTFHARQLGVDVATLNSLVHALTGMLYADFVRELTYVAAKDLMKSNHHRYLNEVADFLGFRAYSSLFRLIKQKDKRSPTGQYRMSYEEQMKQLEEMRQQDTR